MNLILLEPDEISGDGVVVLSGRRDRHVREVLHATLGDTLRVGVLNGPTGTAVVEEYGESICLRCTFRGDPPPVPAVDLLLAMPRPKVMNRLWPVLASLGVGSITIIQAHKTRRDYFDSHVLDPPHVRAGLIEGLEQSCDTRLPRVCVHRPLHTFFAGKGAHRCAYAAQWFAHPSGNRSPLATLAALPPHGRVRLAIGPEGGWTPAEKDLMASNGFAPLSWGPRPLRSDTACCVLLGLIHAAIEAANAPA